LCTARDLEEEKVSSG